MGRITRRRTGADSGHSYKETNERGGMLNRLVSGASSFCANTAERPGTGGRAAHPGNGSGSALFLSLKKDGKRVESSALGTSSSPSN